MPTLPGGQLARVSWACDELLLVPVLCAPPTLSRTRGLAPWPPQAPSVDLEALTRQLEEMHGQVDEQVRCGDAVGPAYQSWAPQLCPRAFAVVSRFNS